MDGERGVPPGSPGQWTVVAITPGVGAGEGASPLPAGGGTRRTPTPPGDDELPERTGRALTDCPPTRIKTVFRGGGRLTTDRSIIPETDVCLLNWTISSRVSIPNVSAYGAPPHNVSGIPRRCSTTVISTPKTPPMAQIRT